VFNLSDKCETRRELRLNSCQLLAITVRFKNDKKHHACPPYLLEAVEEKYKFIRREDTVKYHTFL
jgi:hypothetical protein